MTRPFTIMAYCLCFGCGLTVGLLKSKADIEELRSDRDELHEHLRQRDNEIELSKKMIKDLVKQHIDSIDGGKAAQ